MLRGRAEQLSHLHAFLEDATTGGSSLLHVVGEPGIGKTSLVEAAVGSVSDLRTLHVVGVQSERSLSLAALVSVIRAVSAALDELTPQSAHVLRALLDAGDAQTPMAISSATLQLLGIVAERRPTVVVVDDAQWVDPESLAALVFAARRMQADPFALIVVSRDDARLELPGVDQLRLHGLDAAASAELLRSAGPMAPVVVAACTERCAGNPLALRLIAEALTPAQRSGVEELPARLPLGDALSAALRARLDVLPPRTRRALLVVALGGRLTGDQLGGALGWLGLELPDLDPAHEHGIVTSENGFVAFTHPLLAEVARVARKDDLRDGHVALARVTDGDRRSWHLIDSGTLSTSATLAELDALVASGALRGAHGDMANAAAEAARRTDSAEERARRLLIAGRGWRATASYSQSIGVLREALATTADPRLAAEVAEVLSDAVGFETSVPEAIRLLTETATPIVRDDPARAATLLGLASQYATLAAEAERAVELGAQAESIADAADDLTRLAVRVLSTHALVNHGRPVEAERLTELDAVAGAVGPDAPLELLSLAQVVAFDLFTIERWDAADELFDHVVSAAKRASYVGVHVFGSAMRGEVLWRLGRWSEARAEANADVEHHLRLDVVQGGFGHATLARVAAATGATGEAVRIARLAVEHGDRIGMASMSAWGRHALGLAALADDRPDDAVQHLDWIWRLCRRGRVENPGILWWQGDLLEAFVLAGAPDDARRLLSWMEGVGSPYGTEWPHAILDRGRGLVHGDPDAARCSVRRLTAARAPFEAARSRLVAASLADDAERRVEAERALDVFEALGAVRWERDARTILGAGDRPVRPASSTLLTPAELRVALAVSEGMTNRQAATALALSPKTVDAHLQAIYRKLGVRGRTELALAISRERESAIGRPVPSRTTGT